MAKFWSPLKKVSTAQHRDMWLRRKRLPQLFPSLLFYFQPADIVTQILNFGLPAPIDIQVAGFDPKNYDIARHIRERIAGIPGIVDSHVHQVVDGPDLHYEIDRARAVQFGLTAQDVSNSMNVSLSSSTQVQPNFYLDPRMGITYFVAAQTPQDRLQSVADVGNTPVSVRNSNEPQLLSNLVSVTHAVQPVNVNHRNVQPVFDVYANVQDADLGSVADHIDTVVKVSGTARARKRDRCARASRQMRSAFSRLGLGLVAAALLVYLLMVVNFQSWKDPFIIITALPGAFAGVRPVPLSHTEHL